jgi:hypothetical protein
MKLSELTPCAKCGGKLVPIWYVVRISMAMLARKATSSVLGLSQMFSAGNPLSGQALAIAEVMAPGADEAVIIAGDKDKSLMTEFNLCQQCYLEGHLALIQESLNAR